MDNTATVSSNGVEVTLRRKTVLSEAKSQAIISKMALFYIELAAELEEEPQAVDVALSKFANISAQAVGESKGVMVIKPSDTVDVMRLKSRTWLIDTHPDVAMRLTIGLDEVDATWNEPAMAEKLPETSDPK